MSKRKKRPARAGSRRPARGPRAGKAAAQPFPREAGPRSWLVPLLESTYTRLAPRDRAPGAPPAAPAAAAAHGFRSRLQPGRGAEVLEAPAPSLWLDRVREYRARRAAAARPRPARAAMAPAG